VIFLILTAGFLFWTLLVAFSVGRSLRKDEPPPLLAKLDDLRADHPILVFVLAIGGLGLGAGGVLLTGAAVASRAGVVGPTVLLFIVGAVGLGVALALLFTPAN